MEENNFPYEKTIFVCVNKIEGKPCCDDHKGLEVFKQLRQIAKDRGLHPKIRVTQAKCLGQCAKGVTVMVYPDQIWYCQVSLNDVEQLAEKHLSPPA